jgi:hypothetical protein
VGEKCGLSIDRRHRQFAMPPPAKFPAIGFFIAPKIYHPIKLRL